MTDTIEIHATPWLDMVLVCRKCSRKLGGEGFGPERDLSLPRALKVALREGGRRREVRVVETKCLGLCPKRAVTVVLARNPGAMLAIPAGTPAGALLDRLRPG